MKNKISPIKTFISSIEKALAEGKNVNPRLRGLYDKLKQSSENLEGKEE